MLLCAGLLPPPWLLSTAVDAFGQLMPWCRRRCCRSKQLSKAQPWQCKQELCGRSAQVPSVLRNPALWCPASLTAACMVSAAEPCNSFCACLSWLTLYPLTCCPLLRLPLRQMGRQPNRHKLSGRQRLAGCVGFSPLMLEDPGSHQHAQGRPNNAGTAQECTREGLEAVLQAADTLSGQ